jgi:hypothetical protein
MATLLRDPKTQEYDIVALQEPWRNPFISTTHNPIPHSFYLCFPKDSRDSSSSLVHRYIFLSFKVPLPPCPQSQSSCYWTLTGNTLLSPYYRIPHSPYVRANQAVEGVRHPDRVVALGRSVARLVWGFSLESSFLSFSVPVSRREIQAEGGRGTAMTGGIIIDDKHSVYMSRRRCNSKGFNTEDAQYKGSKIAKIMLIF